MHFQPLLYLVLSLSFTSAIPTESSNNHPFFYQGHDLSSLPTLEAGGAIFKDTAKHNITRSAEAILKDGGMNTVRLRIWVDPVGGTNGLEYNLVAAKRFQDEGFRVYLDFHFS